MATNIDLASFPVAVGEEPSHLHFESLRRRIWALWHLSAGHDLVDYTESNTAATSPDGRGATILWATYVDNLGLLGDTVEVGEISAHLHFGLDDSSGSPSDLFVNWKEMNEAQLDAYPPLDDDGELNAVWWKRYPDPNKYHHFDRNSDRWIVSRIGRSDPSRSHELVVEAWRWLPRHTDPYTQVAPVKYTDTGRIVQRSSKVEVNRKHITQTFSLGAKYDAQPYTEAKGGPRVEPIYGEIQPGNQYTNDPGEPGDSALHDDEDILPERYVDPDDTTDNKHWAFEAKVCAAYQNAIEWLVSKGEWALETDATYKANYEAYNNETSKQSSLGDWDAGTPYVIGNIVLGSDDHYYQATSNSTGQDPTLDDDAETYWSDIHNPWDPDHVQAQHHWVSIMDKFWGCNEGAIELLLKKAESFDWYFDNVHPWAWQDLIGARFEESEAPPSTEDLMYPLADGTWRRTWKYGMGRILATMRSSEDTEPEGEEWVQTTPTTWMTWPGKYNKQDSASEDQDPGVVEGSYSTTEEFEQNLISRHDPVQINYDENDNDKAYPQHEITAAMVNEIYNVLVLLGYKIASSLTLTMKEQVTTVTACTGGHATAQAALDAHEASLTKTDAPTDSWDAITGSYAFVGMDWQIEDEGGAGSGTYKLNTSRRMRIALKVSGALSDGLYIADTLWWKCRWEKLWQDNIGLGDPYQFFWDCDVGTIDEQVLEFTHPPGFKPAFPNAPPIEYKFINMPVPKDNPGADQWMEMPIITAFPDDVTHQHGYAINDRCSYDMHGYIYFTGWAYGDVIIHIDWDLFPDSVWTQTDPIETLIAVAVDPE